MVDYLNGKIYKITNCEDNEVYVGSTCQSLSKRFSKHKKACYNNTKNHTYFYQYVNKLGFDRFCITLIEDYPCNNRTELRAREGVFIREQGTLNTQIEGRTYKQWKEDNKERIVEKAKEYREKTKEQRKEYYKAYRIENKDKIAESSKNWRENNKEWASIKSKENYQANIDVRREQHKNWYNDNKEDVIKKRTVLIQCDVCKTMLQKNSISRHQKTKKCQSFTIGHIGQ